MRAAVFVLALLVVGSNAFLLDSLNDTFAPHIETLKQAGSQLLSGLVAKGKEVLGALLSKASDAVSQFTTPAIGRRSLLGDKLKQWWTKAQAFNQEVMSKMEGQKHVSGNLFSGALNKLKALYNKLKANKAAFKGADDFSKAVDDVVDEHADMQKRFLFTLKDVQDAASSAFDVAKDIATSDAAKALAAQAAQAALDAAIAKGKREDKRFLVSFDDIKAAAGSALSAAKDLATSDAAKALAAQAAQAALAAAIGGKREDKRFLISFDDIKAAAGSALNIAKDIATSDAAKALAAQAAQAALDAAIAKGKREDKRFLVSFDDIKAAAGSALGVVKDIATSDTAKALAAQAAQAALAAAIGKREDKRFLVSFDDIKAAAGSALGVVKDLATSDTAKALAAAAAKAALVAALTKREDKRFLVSFDDIKAAAGSALNAAKDLATSDAAKALAAQAAQAALAAAIGKREDKRFLVSFDDIKAAAGSALNVAKDIVTSDAAKALAAQAAQAALAAAIGKREDKRFLVSFDDIKAAAGSALGVAKDIVTSDAAKALAAQAAQAALAAAIGGKREDKRFLISFDDIKAAAGSALNVAKDLATSDAAKALAAQAAQAALAAAIGKREDKRFLISFDDIKAAAGTALNAAKDLATSDAAKALAAQAAQAALAAAIGKRTVLSDIGDFFAPHINTLKDAVSGVGSTLKGHATNLWNAVKGSVTDLGTKLSGHVDKLKEHGSTLLDHGKNALDALKGAVGDILSQTLQNIAPAIKGVISTGTDAAGVVSGHIAGAVGGDAAASGSF